MLKRGNMDDEVKKQLRRKCEAITRKRWSRDEKRVKQGWRCEVVMKKRWSTAEEALKQWWRMVEGGPREMWTWDVEWVKQGLSIGEAGMKQWWSRDEKEVKHRWWMTEAVQKKRRSWNEDEANGWVRAGVARSHTGEKLNLKVKFTWHEGEAVTNGAGRRGKRKGVFSLCQEKKEREQGKQEK